MKMLKNSNLFQQSG